MSQATHTMFKSRDHLLTHSGRWVTQPRQLWTATHIQILTRLAIQSTWAKVWNIPGKAQRKLQVRFSTTMVHPKTSCSFNSTSFSKLVENNSLPPWCPATQILHSGTRATRPTRWAQHTYIRARFSHRVTQSCTARAPTSVISLSWLSPNSSIIQIRYTQARSVPHRPTRMSAAVNQSWYLLHSSSTTPASNSRCRWVTTITTDWACRSSRTTCATASSFINSSSSRLSRCNRARSLWWHTHRSILRDMGATQQGRRLS